MLPKQARVCLRGSPVISVGALQYSATKKKEPTVGCIMVNNAVMYETM